MNITHEVSKYNVRVYRDDAITIDAFIEAESEEQATKLAYKQANKRPNKTDVVEIDTDIEEIDEKKPRKVRPGKYAAKERGLLTERNGFIRSGWAGSKVVTVKERLILTEMVDMLEGKQDKKNPWGFSDITIADIAEATDMNTNQIAGAISVLVAKGAVHVVLVKTPEGKKVLKSKLVHLTPYGASLVAEEEPAK